MRHSFLNVTNCNTSVTIFHILLHYLNIFFRFEVQIEVPKPRTVEQRVAILKVHTESMVKNGRVLVKDAPVDTAASKRLRVSFDVPYIAVYAFNDTLNINALHLICNWTYSELRR